jgi:hypothetical protein
MYYYMDVQTVPPARCSLLLLRSVLLLLLLLLLSAALASARAARHAGCTFLQLTSS